MIIRICAGHGCAVTGKCWVELDGATGSTDGSRHFESVIFHTLECFAGDLLEGLLHTDSLLGRGLIERYIIVCLTPFLSLTLLYFTLVLTIDFVTKHDKWE